MVQISKESIVTLDLDDTLYSEYQFLKSGFSKIAHQVYLQNGDYPLKEMLTMWSNKEDVFRWLLTRYQSAFKSKSSILSIYRNHQPDIQLYEDAKAFLIKAKNARLQVALMTDGRSATQRNKIEALGISNYFNEIVISEEFGSEKPDRNNYIYIEEKFPKLNFVFIGDNPRKDFISPNQLGWMTIGLKDRGHNIHNQNLELSAEYQPHHWIMSFDEIIWE